MGRNTRNFLITMAIIGSMILAINLVLKDLIYYRRVKKDQDITSSERYLREFPGGFYAQTVKEKLDEYSFQEAEKVGTAEAYDQYINKFKHDGKFIEEAKQQSEALHFEGMSNRADLEEIIRFLKRFPDSRYKEELQNLESELWAKHQADFNAYAKSNGYKSEMIQAFNDLFGYMKEKRFTHIYLGISYDEEHLKDWNDYPGEVRLLWDDPANLQKTFDQALITGNRDNTRSDSSESNVRFPTELRVPSDNAPMPITRYMNDREIKGIFKNVPEQLKAELQKAIKFPILHAVKDSRDIPKNAPALVLGCYPINREARLEGLTSPVFFMRLKERRDQRRNDLENNHITASFNGYMLAVDVKWSLALKEGQYMRQELYAATYPSKASTYFLYKKDLSEEYTHMVERTYERFQKDLARQTNFDLTLNK